MNNDKMNKKPRKELPIKQKLINRGVDESRENLISGQLELKFLEKYLEDMTDPKNTEVTECAAFMSSTEIKKRIEEYVEINQYHLARMQYYKDLKAKSIDTRNALKDYAKCPTKLAINGDSVEVVE